MSCSLPPRELTTKTNSNTKAMLKLALKRYFHSISCSVLFQRLTIANCALEISHRSPTRRGELFSLPPHFKEVLIITVRSQHGGKRLSQVILVTMNLQWWGQVLRPVKRGSIIAIQVPGFCLLAKSSRMHHIAALLEGRCLASMTNRTSCALCLAILFVRLSDTRSPKAHTSR